MDIVSRVNHPKTKRDLRDGGYFLHLSTPSAPTLSPENLQNVDDGKATGWEMAGGVGGEDGSLLPAHYAGKTGNRGDF